MVPENRHAKKAERSAEIEIDLYLDGQMTSGNEKPQLHFHGPVGAVQTGAHSRADVLQNISAEDRGALTRALVELREAIENAHELHAAQRRELIEVAAECEQVSASGAGTIRNFAECSTSSLQPFQSIASAQPVYAALRAAVAPLGISLP
jgi:hypothetical protein